MRTRTTSLDTTRPSTIFYRLLLNWASLRKALETLPNAHHVTRHNTLFHNILSTAPQLSISQNALGTLPDDGNVMPKHVGATIHN
jgi:hypothetical protein